MRSGENDALCGVICIDKPAGMTSHDVVNRLRRLYMTRRIGHTGTLDPMATGVMCVLIGRAAKAAEYVTAADKHYIAGMRLGLRSDTGDITGVLETTGVPLPGEDAVQEAAASFRGGITQVPPMYSALKVGGKKLVDLARQGIEIGREARPVTIYRLEAAPVPGVSGEYRLDVICSKGTYIRTLCTDIGDRLGCGAVMSSLRRTASGRFTLDGCVTLEALEAMTPEERIARLAPVETLFADWPAVRLPAFYERLARSGCEIYLKKLGIALPEGTMAALYGSTGFFAVAGVCMYPGGPALKPLKQFALLPDQKEGADDERG